MVRLHGIPESSVSDRDKKKLIQLWKELVKLKGTTLKRSTTYHPQTDGQMEVVNRCLEIYLRCFVMDSPRKWVTWLPWAEYWYNTSFHTSTKTTPFRVLYGRDPPYLLCYGQNGSPVGRVRGSIFGRTRSDSPRIVGILDESATGYEVTSI